MKTFLKECHQKIGYEINPEDNKKILSLVRKTYSEVLLKIPQWWWMDKKYNLSKLEIKIMGKIALGKGINKIVSEENLTLNQIIVFIESAYQKQLITDSNQ
jgi:hypothetical protein